MSGKVRARPQAEQTMDAVERAEEALRRQSVNGPDDPLAVIARDDLRTLLALARSNSWQDIETAPKDHRRVMLWRGWEMMAGCAPDLKDNVAPVIAKWNHERECWDYAAASSSGSGVDADFTHWQPLPSPPDTGE